MGVHMYGSIRVTKKWLLTLLVVTIAICGIYIGFRLTSPQRVKVIDSVQADGFVYTLINKRGLTAHGDYLVIHRQVDDEEKHRIDEINFSDLKPWKLQLADIDGDGEQEILIAVIKSTHFDDQEKNRLFVFNYDGEKLYKKWTGSQIAGVWSHFYAGDLLSIPGDELIFIERIKGQGDIIKIYYWFNFGFVLLAESKLLDRIKDITIGGENRILITYEKENNKDTHSLTVKDGSIIETE